MQQWSAAAAGRQCPLQPRHTQSASTYGSSHKWLSTAQPLGVRVELRALGHRTTDQRLEYKYNQVGNRAHVGGGFARVRSGHAGAPNFRCYSGHCVHYRTREEGSRWPPYSCEYTKLLEGRRREVHARPAGQWQADRTDVQSSRDTRVRRDKWRVGRESVVNGEDFEQLLATTDPADTIEIRGETYYSTVITRMTLSILCLLIGVSCDLVSFAISPQPKTSFSSALAFLCSGALFPQFSCFFVALALDQ